MKKNKVKSTSINSNEQLAIFRLKLHRELIEKLKKVYGKQVWKYTFIKNALDKYNVSVQYKQLHVFEEGGSRNENILNLILLEILSIEGNYQIELDSTRSVVSIELSKKKGV